MDGVLEQWASVPEVIGKPSMRGGWEELAQDDCAESVLEGWEELAQDALFNCEGTALVGLIMSGANCFFSLPGIAHFLWWFLEAK